MKREKWFFFSIVFVQLCLSAASSAQNWAGILSSSRATDWSKAGLPATLPDGEVVPNPWTPPTRSKCGSTVAAGTSFATIQSLYNACAQGTYLLLGPGNFSGSTLDLSGANGVTLRGSGGDQTKLTLTGSITWRSSVSQPLVSWTSGYAAGTTVITMGATPPVNSVVTLEGSGSSSDNGAVWICASAGICSSEGGTAVQYENHHVVSASGGTVTIAPPIAFPAFASLASPSVAYTTPGAWGAGLEDLSIDGGTSGNLTMWYTYASWMKGVRFVNGTGPVLDIKNSVNYLVANNYFAQTGTNASVEVINGNTNGFGLYINNIFQGAGSFIQGPGAVDVYAYNLCYLTANNGFVNNTISNHTAAYSLILNEGNECGNWQDDNIHGTSNLNTFFRNIFMGNDPSNNATGHNFALDLAGVARFENVIGNVMGHSGSGTYKCITGNETGPCVLTMGLAGNTGISDSLSTSSAMFWGNHDTVTNAVRWCGNSSDPGWSTTCSSTSEVPTSLGGNAATYNNAVPSSTTLPASFFLPTTAHPNGGTGLSWWKVCTNYPTCSSTTTVPFPPAGPDVTGGNINGTGGFPNYQGHANHIPAYVAFSTLPVDSNYSGTFAIHQFNESAYMNDSGGTGAPTPPTNLMATVN